MYSLSNNLVISGYLLLSRIYVYLSLYSQQNDIIWPKCLFHEFSEQTMTWQARVLKVLRSNRVDSKIPLQFQLMVMNTQLIVS